jgi:hypothetical protein
MENTTKIQAFHYVVKVLTDYGLDVLWNGGVVLSKLTSQKLLFMTCTYGEGLFDVFDDFWALPYGPVEGCILPYLNTFTIAEIDKIIILSPETYVGLDPELAGKIVKAVGRLVRKNQYLKIYSESSLIEKSHLYPSWYKTYSIAQANGKRAQKIDRELLLAEEVVGE